MPTDTFCCECDAAPGECQHDGLRYHDPIIYEKVEHGWRVPDHERTRWNYDGWRDHHNPVTTPSEQKPLPLSEIQETLSRLMLLDETTRTLLCDSYDKDPVRTTRIAEHVKNNATQLRNPAGLLVKHLREIP